MQTLWQDLRYGARILLKNPGFTLIAALTLSLGIGANTAIFSVINAVLLKPLPYAEPERLVAVWETRKDGGRGSVSYPNFADWRAQNGVFEQIAVYDEDTMALTGVGEAANLRVVITAPDLFPLLGVRPQLGRSFLPEEEKAGSRVVVLGEGAWRRHFSADPSVVGRQIMLDGRAFTVTGVMPAGFDFPVKAEPTDLWVSAAISFERSSPGDMATNERRTAHTYRAIARLKPGVTLAAARADLEAVMGRLRMQYPVVSGDRTAMQPYLDEVVGDAEWALLVLFGAVGMVLLIACANVASLLLARGMARRRELAVRAALGANRLRIVQQLGVESLLLASLGGLAALLLAVWGVDLLKALGPENLPRVQDARLDGRALIFALLVTLLTGVIFGIIPALRAARVNLNETLNEGGRSGEGLRRNRLRGALIVVEVALSLVLLVGAGLLINSFARLLRVNPGFDPHQVLTLRVDLPDAKYGKPEQSVNFNRELLKRIEATPGVRSAAMVFKLPLSGDDASTIIQIEGQPEDTTRYQPAGGRIATPGYFRTMGIPFISGRDFAERDDLKSTPVIIINETLAQLYFPNQNPIGKRINPGVGVTGVKPLREIIGVTRSVRHRGLEKEPRPEYYLPQAQAPDFVLTTVVRTAGDPLAIVGAVRNEVRALDSELPVYSVKTLDQYFAESVAQPRFNTLLLALFAGVAMILTAVGLYGVIAYSVEQRTREIGVRMALGAQTGDVLRLIVGQGMKLAMLGVAIGLVTALALTRLMKGLLFGVSASDPLTFAVITLLLMLVALLACWIPARRATKVDPMIALRCD